MAENEPGHPWTRVIPEFYYDIIARIPAGLVLVFSVTWVSSPTLVAPLLPSPVTAELIKALMAWAPAVIFLLLLLVFSYTGGLLVTTIGSLISRPLVCQAWKTAMNTREPVEGSRRSKYKTLMEQQEYSKSICDYVDKSINLSMRHSNKSAHSLLPKVRAEAALSANMFAASSLSIFYAIAWNLCFPTNEKAAIPNVD